MNDPSQWPVLRQATVDRLETYLKQQEGLRPLNDFESIMRHVEAGQAARHLDPEVQKVAERLWKVAKDSFFLFRVSHTKIAYVIRAMCDVLNGDNPLASALLVRALIEHVASLNIEISNVDSLLGRLKGQTNPPKIGEALSLAEETIRRCYYGSGRKSEAGPKPYNVVGLVRDHLAKRVKDIEEVYDYLCEYVHPNHGSNALVSSGVLSSGKLDPPVEYHWEVLKKLCGYSILTVQLLDDLAMDEAASLAQLQKLHDIALQPKADLKTLFAVRSLKPKGDGKSKDTAFSFPAARNPAEAIQMIYEHLNQQGIGLTGMRQLMAREDGYAYDLLPTTAGDLWFKSPMMEAGDGRSG